MDPNDKRDARLAAIRQAANYAFPAPDVEQMLEEIERGYQEMPERLGLGFPNLAPGSADVIIRGKD